MHARVSILDLAPLRRGETATDSFAASVALAQRAHVDESLTYTAVGDPNRVRESRSIGLLAEAAQPIPA